MTSFAVNYQLSIFGRYSITPTPDIVTSLMTKINNATGQTFLPNIFTSQQIEIPSNKVTFISNLGFTTSNQKYNITILNDRIDFNYNKSDAKDLLCKDFCAIAVKGLSEIMHDCNLKSNRLALNIQFAEEIIEQGLLNKIGKQLVSTSDYYDEKALLEWSNRVNSRIKMPIKEVEEEFNAITEISSGMVSINGVTKPAVICHLDINTIAENSNMRFDFDTIAPFAECALTISDEIKSGIEGLIEGV